MIPESGFFHVVFWLGAWVTALSVCGALLAWVWLSGYAAGHTAGSADPEAMVDQLDGLAEAPPSPRPMHPREEFVFGPPVRRPGDTLE